MMNPYESSVVKNNQDETTAYTRSVKSWVSCLAVIAAAWMILPAWFVTADLVLDRILPPPIFGDGFGVFVSITQTLSIVALLIAVLGGMLAPRSWPWKVLVGVLAIIAIPVCILPVVLFFSLTN